MIINKKTEQATLILAPEGRLDTVTAPELETELEASLAGVKKLVLDFKDVTYVSSAGLRVILKAQKAMAAKGGMTLKNVNETIMEIFEVTGFADILTVENEPEEEA